MYSVLMKFAESDQINFSILCETCNNYTTFYMCSDGS